MLFAASFATIALSSVWDEAEFEEVIALAVWAGQGDSDGHEDILTPPTTSNQTNRIDLLEDLLSVLPVERIECVWLIGNSLANLGLSF